ncbi:MAG TPA: cold shock domain-containing protein [Vicinamibacterales bacterium]|nr:cold shock domain-containing protein [Vicinamibacterales bacterium]
MSAARQTGKPGRPKSPEGTPASGRIVRLLVGQSFGFIKGPRGREIFFHRADVKDGTAFNTLTVGDAVTFDLIDDAVSGARAIGVARRRTATRK